MTDSLAGALDGIRVIDLTSALLGPIATQILGDLGADVIKVEPPAGDPMRHLGPARNAGMAAMYLGLNRNKRSVVLDLKTPDDRAALDALIEGADVLVHNTRPGAARRLGIDQATLRARHPRLIHASAVGFGSAEDSERSAYDEVVQAASGIAGAIEKASGTSGYVPFAIADKVVGHILASAISTALFARERTGAGQEVLVPMYETMVEFNLLEHSWGRAFDPPLSGPGYARLFSPARRPFPTLDGVICVAPTTDWQWRKLFTAIGRPELAEDERFADMAQRSYNFSQLFDLLADELAGRTTEHWTTVFAAADLPHGPAPTLDELFEDEKLNGNGLFQHYDHPSEGRLTRVHPAVRFSATPIAFRRPPPRLGEHTEQILGDLNDPNHGTEPT